MDHIFGKRPWVSRSAEIIEDNTPKLEDMPDAVKAAQAEHEKSIAEAAAKQLDSNDNADGNGTTEDNRDAGETTEQKA